ncbi:MAG: acetylxylan esterase [Bryobacteraceae bacterium]|nr:acetylxylan esterase [Bryobacteraceae bacterium]
MPSVPRRPCAALLIVMAGAAWAQQAPRRHSAEERYALFEQNLKRRAGEIARQHLADIKTVEDWKRERPRRKQQMLSMLGLDPLPPKTPLGARITGTLDRDGYRVEKIVFQSMPRLYVTGNLYLPAKLEGRHPTVLYLCGHSPSPFGSKVDYQRHGIWFARHGYVALLIDTIEFGELSGIHHGTHDLDMLYWLSLGYTPAGPEVWNAIRALDYLETRPEVDPARIAITGMSGGGAMTWFTAAVDDRPRVAVPVVASWTIDAQIQEDVVHHNCDCIYFHNTYQADLPLAAALIAPRPLKMISAQRDDSFPPAGYRAAYERSRRIYELFGAGDKIAAYEQDAQHQDLPEFRKEAAEWIGRWLKDDRTPFDEGKIEPEPKEALLALDAYPPDAVNESIDRVFIPAPAPVKAADRRAWETQSVKAIAELRESVFRLFPSRMVPFDAWKQKRGGWSDRYADHFDVEFNTESDIRVHAELFLPRTKAASHPALIFVKGRDDVIYPVDWDRLLPALANHVVLTLYPRAVDYPMNNYRWATVQRSFALLGGTIETMQTWDILRAIDYLVEGEGLRLDSVSLFGRKAMGALSIYAGALDKRVTRVIVENPPATHWHDVPLLNVLRIADLPEAAALLAPRELVALGPLPREYERAREIYHLYKASDRMRPAGGLGEALRVWEFPNAVGRSE